MAVIHQIFLFWVSAPCSGWMFECFRGTLGM